ncbi:motility protein B [Clostridium tepidiprofundi DSM 19306]|uniref:Motility protein B n=1 Tax=Clostridium tepidiprofundi DSM 19306 TaxID=1121338 RepID=A0A151B6T3_9CLOT|nr:OmpA family protein [Clostridium tepidiprofundi]KYH35609.1 motility protein B [Clostridium tepidiprofundi DSM 19306]
MSKRKSKGSGIDPNAWLTTYSDTITLLLTFFVLLYSFSTVDAEKFRSIANALQTVLSGNPSRTVLELNMSDGDVPMIGMPVPMTKKNGGDSNDDMYESMNALLEENNLKDVVDVRKDSRGYIFELKDKILFETGQAYLKEDSKPILDVITKYISSIKNQIIIEGHTDNVPIHNSKYYDNWDLSSARANTVARYFIKVKGITPQRIVTMGFGEYHPLVKNDTPEHRAMNRRVNILIVTKNNQKDGDN